MTNSEARAAYYEVVLNACRGLGNAARALAAAEDGCVRPPRPRFIKITDSLTWPYQAPATSYYATGVHFNVIVEHVTGSPVLVFDLTQETRCVQAADLIVYKNVLRPRGVYRSLRRLQAAQEWCRDRANGLEREIDEIFRQQARWHTLLVREHNFLQLGNTHTI